MTGFGDARAAAGGVALVAEIKSLNNRFFKPVIRLPDTLSFLEPEIETLLRRKLGRGSVFLSIKIDADEEARDRPAATIDVEAVQNYAKQLAAAGLAADTAALLSLPGVVTVAEPEELVPQSDDLKGPAIEAVKQAMDSLIAARKREGQALEADLRQHLDAMGGHLTQIGARSGHVVTLYHERVRARVNELLQEANLEVAREDLLREVAVFAERSDISEEVQRLGHHVQQFRDAIADDGGEHVGRKLDFIAQEMLREANTIGSKAQDADIAGRVIEIKGSIDRLKEQVQNVE